MSMAVTDDPTAVDLNDLEDTPLGVPTPDRPVYKLPPEAYFDPGWYAREQRELFGRTWNLVGHHTDLPGPGTFLTVEVAGTPAMVVRGADGTLTAFANICRHRGMTVLQGDDGGGTGTCGTTLRCGYHGWEWDTGGTLVRIPQRRSQFPDLDTDEYGLHPFAVAEWGGFIFVHPRPQEAGSFVEWLDEFPALTGEFPFLDLVEIKRIRTPLKCNWKLYIENHIDWLHLWYLHDDSLGMYDHRNGVVEEAGLHWASTEMMRPGRDRPASDGLAPIPGMPTDEMSRLRANLIFPNVPFVTTGTQINSYQVIPTGPETSLLDLRVFGVPGGVLTDEAVADQMGVLVGEDGAVCERMQEAVRSPLYAVGPLALVHEAPIMSFHHRVERFMGPSVGLADG